MKNILITGGLGYIGSHIVVELLTRKDSDGKYIYNIFIVDNLENSNKTVINNIIDSTIQHNPEKRIDVCIFDILKVGTTTEYFKQNKFDAIIHCAGKKAVSESIEMPIEYYHHNLSLLTILLSKVKQYDIKDFIFSSSATVYGSVRHDHILTEDDKTGENINNPYGKTKYIQEIILKDFYKTRPDLNCVILRYFNPVGCHPSGILGENPKGIPNNIMPYICRVADNNNKISKKFTHERYEKLTIFGNDYETYDGTCIRDFIHVSDLARAHIDVLDFDTKSSDNLWIFNVGTGKGTSVLELVSSFIRENNVKLNYCFGDRRAGDEVIVVCDNTKITQLTNWSAKYDIDDIVRHNWGFVCQE